MSNTILKLRNFSLRWSIVILFVATIISGLGAISSGGSFTVTGFILVAGSILFYGTWCAQAIADVKKAGITFAILAIALIINFFGQMNSLSESPDFVGMAFNSVFGDGSALNDWVYKKIMYSYKTTLLLNILSAGAFIYAFTGVDDKYKVSWAIMMAAFAISAFNLYSLANGNRDIEAYQSLNNIVAWITALVFIILLVQGNNKTIAYYTPNTPNTPNMPYAPNMPNTSYAPNTPCTSYAGQRQVAPNYSSGNVGKDNLSTSYKTLGIIAAGVGVAIVLVIIIALCSSHRSETSYDYDVCGADSVLPDENYYPESYESEAVAEEVEQPSTSYDSYESEPSYNCEPSYNNDYSSGSYDDNSADVWE